MGYGWVDVWMSWGRLSKFHGTVIPPFKIHPGPRTIRVKQIARHEYRHNAWSEEVKSYNFPFIWVMGLVLLLIKSKFIGLWLY